MTQKILECLTALILMDALYGNKYYLCPIFTPVLIWESYMIINRCVPAATPSITKLNPMT